MKPYRLLSVLTAIALFASCALPGDGRWNDTTDITFNIPGVVARAGESTLEPNYLYFLYNQDEGWLTSREPVTNASLTVSIPKGSIALFSLLHVPEEAGSPIETVGNVRVIEDLDSLPISDEATNSINIDLILAEDSTYVSTLTVEELADAVGYTPEALAVFAYFDGIYTQFLNPDSDRNGVFDEDEALSTVIDLWMDIPLFEDDFDFGAGTSSFDFEGRNKPEHCMFLVGVDGFTEVDAGSAALVLPADAGAVNSAGEPVTELSCHNAAGVETGPGIIYGFSFDNADVVAPTPPISGDYVLRLGSDELVFNNLLFPDFSQPDQTGFIFPIIDFDLVDNVVTEVRWKWMIQDATGIRRPTIEELAGTLHRVELVGPTPYINLEDLGVDPRADGSVDVSSYGATYVDGVSMLYVTAGNLYIRTTVMPAPAGNIKR